MKKMPFGESETVQFKSKPASLEKEIVAFANARGGTLYIGVDDNGMKTQLKLDNRVRSQIINSIHNCDPMPEFDLQERDGIVELIIHEGSNKPYKAPDGFYLRLGASSQKLNRDQILKFSIKENRLQFDSQIFEWVDNLAESDLVDILRFHRFRELTAIDNQISDQKLLSNLNLIKQKGSQFGLTNALLLMFSSQTTSLFPHARTICWVMKDEASILKQHIIEGDLFYQLAEAISFTEVYLQNAYQIQSLQRNEVPEIPKAVLRELVVNALVHRDYFEHGAETQIKIYPDRLQIANPCSLPVEILVDKLFGNSLRPNPILAEAFQRVGYIERAGTGLLRVNSLLKASSLPNIKIVIDGPFFVVEVKRQATLLELSELTERQHSIVNLLEKNHESTSKELAKLLKVSDRTVRSDMSILMNRDIVIRKNIGRRRVYKLRRNS